MKRSPLVRKPEWKPLRRSTKPIARQSVKKRRAARGEAECKRVITERSGGRCEVCPRLHTGSVRRGTDKHEIKTRARGGDPTDPSNTLLSCRVCHSWIDDHPEEAHTLGLLRHAWE